MKYKFIDIGCGHQSVSSDIFGTSVVGMYVEPIKEFIDVLPSGPNIIKECCVVSNVEDTITFNAIIPDSANIKYFTNTQMTRIVKNDKSLELYRKLYPASGQSSLYEYEKNQNISKKINVRSLTLESLFKKHNVTEIDYLKIDVEGAEHIILNQLLKLLDDKKIIINKQIKFEYNEKAEDKTILDDLMERIKLKHGFNSRYEFTFPWNEDMVMDKME